MNACHPMGHVYAEEWHPPVVIPWNWWAICEPPPAPPPGQTPGSHQCPSCGCDTGCSGGSSWERFWFCHDCRYK